jgi:hypothetical protein
LPQRFALGAQGLKLRFLCTQFSLMSQRQGPQGIDIVRQYGGMRHASYFNLACDKEQKKLR